MFHSIFSAVRRTAPLVHCITNYVTANDCANLLLACGASPIMADAPEEAAEIASICSGLTLNLGTLSTRTAEAMLIAGSTARAKGRPIVLDPVGAGASHLRTDTALRLLREVRPTVLRGNLSEIRALTDGTSAARGVDAAPADRITEQTLDEAAVFARRTAAETGAVVVITGAIDLVADPDRVYCIRNGHPMMSSVTGTGCQLSALTAAFVAAAPGQPLEAAAAAVCAMGLAGELAYRQLAPQEGNTTYRSRIVDAIYRMTPAQLEEGARYELH